MLEIQIMNSVMKTSRKLYLCAITFLHWLKCLAAMHGHFTGTQGAFPSETNMILGENWHLTAGK